jgi:hypothetical protein
MPDRRPAHLVILGALLIAGMFVLVLAQLLPGRGTSAPAATPAGQAGQPVPPVDLLPWDGVGWQRLRIPGEPAEFVYATSVVAGGPGIVVLGQGPNPNIALNKNGLNQTLTAWSSRDGGSWQVVPILAGVGLENVAESYSAAAAGPLGIVVAGGICCKIDRPAIWWSPDGVNWAASLFPPGQQIFFNGVAAGGDGFVAVGTRGARGAIWTSPDGRGWSLVQPEAEDIPVGRVNSVAPLAGGYIAAGIADPGRDSDAAVWRSSGLEGWERLGLNDPILTGEDEMEFYEVVPFAGGILATGGIGSQQDRIDCRQMGAAPAAALPESAHGCGWLNDGAWSLRDGATWERLAAPGGLGQPGRLEGPPPGRRLTSLSRPQAGGPGLVTIGWEQVGSDDGGAAALWVSGDGNVWDRVGWEVHFPAGTSADDFAASGRRVYAVGTFPLVADWSKSEPSLWIGSIRQ